MLSAAPCATYNVHRGNHAFIDPSELFRPSHRARYRAALALRETELAQTNGNANGRPAPAPVPAPTAVLKPAWAKSGDEIFMKLDLINARRR